MAIVIERCERERFALSSLEEIKGELLRIAEVAGEDERVDVTVTLDHGSYFLSSPLCLSVKENPTLSRLCLHLKAKAGMRPCLTGNLPLRGAAFAPCAGGETYVYRFERDVEGKYPLFRDLYVNGKRLSPARSASFVNPYQIGRAHV